MNQQRELLLLKQQYFGSIDSLIGTFGDDQSCFTFRTSKINYEQMKNDENYRQNVCQDFKEKVSQCLKVEFDDIEILGFRQGSTQIDFKIIKTKADLINLNQFQYLETVCEGKIEYYNYYAGCKLGLSLSDFNPSFNMRWDNFHEKEQRGPPYQRYDYYFPRGCQGFGLNVDPNQYGKNLDWLQMNGNQNEWRIMFHGTKQQYVTQIVQNNLQPGAGQGYQSYDCLDIESGKQIKVGRGIYFSDIIDVCIKDGYASPVDVCGKKFVVLFMSRVNPRKIRQADAMKGCRYFVVNDSQDVRPYRILLKQVP